MIYAGKPFRRFTFALIITMLALGSWVENLRTDKSRVSEDSSRASVND